MQGKIVKGISGFYYVYTAETGIYECKAKGAFRKEKIKPLVGDNVEFAIISEEKRTGNVEAILPRSRELIRPAVSNIDLALIIFAAAKPEPNLNLLDRFLCMMEYQNIPSVICFNKCDLVSEEEKQKLLDIYEPAGYTVLFLSVKNGIGVDAVRKLLQDKTAAVAGPSGVGKSSLINALQENVHMETGAISEKIERGKNTTRHAQIIPINENSFIMDTPGFSSMDLPEMEKENLWNCYPEFREYEPFCRFQGCCHMNEPDCGVKTAVEEGKISTFRYENYKLLFKEIQNRKKIWRPV